MSRLKMQIGLEKRSSKKHITTYLEEKYGRDELAVKPLVQLRTNLETLEVPDNRPDVAEVREYMLSLDLVQLGMDVLYYIISKDGKPATIQEVIGRLFGKMSGLENTHRKLLACSWLVEAATDNPFIKTTVTKGEQTFFESVIALPEPMKEVIRKQGYMLPSSIPLERITKNAMSGYRTISGSVILGGKHHDGYVVLNHINRVNSVAYQYEYRLPHLCEPKFNPNPKVKKNGMWESELDIQLRYKAFLELHNQLPEKLAMVRSISNRFWLEHGYDTRGRTYVKAHHFNYQGTSFVKAMIDLNKKEIIKNEF